MRPDSPRWSCCRAEEPRLTRTKARFELLLQANRDPEIAEVFRHNGEMFTEIHRREIMSRSHSGQKPDPRVLDEQTAATMSFVSGVHMRFIAGDRFIDSAEQLDLLLIGIADGVAAAYRKETSRLTGPCEGNSPDAAELGSGSAVPQLRLPLRRA